MFVQNIKDHMIVNVSIVIKKCFLYVGEESLDTAHIVDIGWVLKLRITLKQWLMRMIYVLAYL